jgi:predicted AAA+ superfamily ATPase
MLLRLLQLLALQIGNEVSYYELAQNLGVDRNTVVRYLDLLEKAFVIFKLRAFSRNLRKEINKKNKIYFYDLGVRNSLVANFNPLSLRSDVGPLWENFCLVERLKSHQAQGLVCHRYFWRTHDQKEIDYLEESGGRLRGFEFKWQKKEVIQPREFLTTYPGSSVSLVNRENYQAFLNLT